MPARSFSFAQVKACSGSAWGERPAVKWKWPAFWQAGVFGRTVSSCLLGESDYCGGESASGSVRRESDEP